MRKASTALLEQGTQAPSPAPDLIPAANERQNLTGNSHSDWYSKRGHLSCPTLRHAKDTTKRAVFHARRIPWQATCTL